MTDRAVLRVMIYSTLIVTTFPRTLFSSVVPFYYSPLPVYPHILPSPRHEAGPGFEPSESIQTLLSSLVKLEEVPEFSCSKEGTFPHPLDCSKYYHCDEELKVTYLCQ